MPGTLSHAFGRAALGFRIPDSRFQNPDSRFRNCRTSRCNFVLRGVDYRLLKLEYPFWNPWGSRWRLTSRNPMGGEVFPLFEARVMEDELTQNHTPTAS